MAAIYIQLYTLPFPSPPCLCPECWYDGKWSSWCSPCYCCIRYTPPSFLLSFLSLLLPPLYLQLMAVPTSWVLSSCFVSDIPSSQWQDTLPLQPALDGKIPLCMGTVSFPGCLNWEQRVQSADSVTSGPHPPHSMLSLWDHRPHPTTKHAAIMTS